MNALNTAIYSRLTGNAPLMAQLPGGVHSRRAPQGTSGRYLVYTKMSGVKGYTFGEAPSIDRYIYFFKVVETAGSAAAARTALDAALTLLTATPLTVTGYQVLLVRREADTEYDELLSGGAVVQHVGSTARIEVVRV